MRGMWISGESFACGEAKRAWSQSCFTGNAAALPAMRSHAAKAVNDGARNPAYHARFYVRLQRMAYDKPSSALTRNLSYACSDNKVHPEQNRVLSLLEAFRLHTLDQFSYQWKGASGRRVADKTVRDVIGESIPPAGLKVILDHVVGIHSGNTKATAKMEEGLLFAHSLG